ncbi:proenkephalin-A [Latimeria chalumnae]|uniref:Prepronociceptin n=1 Tax=Latimeria chalumnae TaxID=7897 RepID=H3A065_LATCH|nr:PREDICTED: prepronociceptin [Latimeria chalumnae]|eukprot:XP_006003131.1 PREDICTED: prepronociceptin [Latimeria chalumnae]
MKTPLWNLLLLSLFVQARSDCQSDCLTCSQHLYQYDNYNTFVCIVECEGKVSSSPTWEVCKKFVGKVSLVTGGESVEGEGYSLVQTTNSRDDSLFGGTLKRYGDVTKLFDLDRIEGEKRVSKISGRIRDREAAEEEENNMVDENEIPLEMDNGQENLYGLRGLSNDISKRFGGFVKGKYDYRKIMRPGREIQKRYGGFIGVRKSARKWNNQKRFSEFLKQYLGISTRSSEFEGLPIENTDQNEI